MGYGKDLLVGVAFGAIVVGIGYHGFHEDPIQDLVVGTLLPLGGPPPPRNTLPLSWGPLSLPISPLPPRGPPLLLGGMVSLGGLGGGLWFLVDGLPSGLDVSFRSPIVVSFPSSKKDWSSSNGYSLPPPIVVVQK